jgi:prepilin-type N-terminal cleavage/methylation domain-containing protein
MMYVSLNKKGLTLVEVMISLVVLLFVSLAMMQTALVSIDSNARNTLRAKAVSLAERIANDARDTADTAGGYASLAQTGYTDVVFTRPAPEEIEAQRMGVTFTKQRRIIDHGVTDKEIGVWVQWQWKGQTYNYSFSTILRNPAL